MIRKKQKPSVKDLKNCPFCGKLFVDKGSGCCPECTLKQLEEKRKIKDYLEANPGARMKDVMKATGVSLNDVSSMVRDGALVKVHTPGTHPCKGCGNPIRTGKFCKACIASMKEARQKSAEEARLAQEKREAEAEVKTKDETESGGIKGLFGKLMGGGSKSEDKKTAKPLLKTERDSRPEPKSMPKEKRAGYYSMMDRWEKK